MEKLCARPLSGSTIKSSLVQPKLSLLAKQQAASSNAEAIGNSSEFEVSSSSVTAVKVVVDVMRKDLPLKKRDSSLGMAAQQCDSTATSGSSSNGSSPSPPTSELAVVTSTNGSSKKPAPRSCKGKRYLEFMYEGRISVLGTGTRATAPGSGGKRPAESSAPADMMADLSTSTPCDQSNVAGRKRRSAAPRSDPSALTSARGSAHQRTSSSKSRKIS